MDDYNYYPIVSDRLINMTGRMLRTYNMCNGDIVELPPSQTELPEQPAMEFGKPITFYIFDKEWVNSLKKLDRPLDDVVIIDNEGIGRGGVKVAYFSSAQNPDVKVRFLKYSASHDTAQPKQ